MSSTKHLCPRCGIERVARIRTSLCMDCRDTMTREERAVWQKPARRRELVSATNRPAPSAVPSLSMLGSGRGMR